MERIPTYFNDPLGFVVYNYPWGQAGTMLAQDPGPDEWQRTVLKHIGDELVKGQSMAKALRTAIRVAAATGHGVGKTALMAWLIQWFAATRPNPAIVVTANTEKQLSTKTWRELSKWHNISLIRPWFEWTATKYYLKEEPETWFASAIPWSENNAEAFAGTHEKYVLILMDEASAIADVIFDTLEGALTGDQAIIVCFGNPTRNTGRFREFWRKLVHRWWTIQVDSRTARKANQAQIKQWLEDWGEDSDFFRIRVRGLFPRQASNQLNPEELVLAAMKREAAGWEWEPVIIACDVARYGDDFTTILVRQGRKVHEINAFTQLDSAQVADKLVEAYDHYKGDGSRGEPVIFIDTTGGLGAGPLDILRRLGYKKTFEVVFGSNARNKEKYFNKRAEMWHLAHLWMKDGALPSCPELLEDLTNIEYYIYTDKRLRLEAKDDLKERIGRSPDWGDALAISFAYTVKVTLSSEPGYADTLRGKLEGPKRSTNNRSPLSTMRRFRKG
jgi:hypothetical protein